MPIDRYWDHRVVIHRYDPVNVDRDEFGDVVPAWEQLTAPSGLNATVDRNGGGTLNDPGPGEIQWTQQHWFLKKDFNIRERDVLQVVTAPSTSQEAGRFYRVESVKAATKPIELHHWEARCRVAEPNVLQLTPETS